VATADLKQPINLTVVGSLDGGSFFPEGYSCAYLSGDPLIGKVAIFGSGKLISVGTRSSKAARHDLVTAAGTLFERGVARPVKITAVVRNVVGLGQLDRPIDLERFCQQEPVVSYEPEVFPGAIWRPDGLHGTLLLFSSGKVVCTAKTVTELTRLMRHANNSVRR
jgi:transcription initiation factor TFIID TATA-box-binding protein